MKQKKEAIAENTTKDEETSLPKKWHWNGKRNNQNRYRNGLAKTYGFSTENFGWYHFSIISSIASTGETIKESRNDCMFLSCHVRVSEWIHTPYRSVWRNGWVFVYELSDCGFESRCNQEMLKKKQKTEINN